MAGAAPMANVPAPSKTPTPRPRPREQASAVASAHVAPPAETSDRAASSVRIGDNGAPILP
jgi:hypothetical protein